MPEWLTTAKDIAKIVCLIFGLIGLAIATFSSTDLAKARWYAYAACFFTIGYSK